MIKMGSEGQEKAKDGPRKGMGRNATRGRRGYGRKKTENDVEQCGKKNAKENGRGTQFGRIKLINKCGHAPGHWLEVRGGERERKTKKKGLNTKVVGEGGGGQGDQKKKTRNHYC